MTHTTAATASPAGAGVAAAVAEVVAGAATAWGWLRGWPAGLIWGRGARGRMAARGGGERWGPLPHQRRETPDLCVAVATATLRGCDRVRCGRVGESLRRAAPRPCRRAAAAWRAAPLQRATARSVRAPQRAHAYWGQGRMGRCARRGREWLPGGRAHARQDVSERSIRGVEDGVSHWCGPAALR
jgi:hypothetical protein